MDCKRLTIFQSDLNYNATKCKQTIVCVESEAIDSDASTIKIILNLSSS